MIENTNNLLSACCNSDWLLISLSLQAPAVAFAQLGYHALLEKPMAVSESDCREITAACESSGVYLAVCHVLRYFPPVVKIKEIIDSGAIGSVMTINHTENVGYWHFAHSFVRGNWRNENIQA